MKRRHFLGASGAVLAGAGATALPLRHALAADATPRFTLLRHDAVAGRYRPLDACGAADVCTSSALVLHSSPLQAASGGAVLARLRISALFDVAGAPRSPFHMLHFDAGDTLNVPRGHRFEAARDTLRTLRIEYRLHDDAPGTCRTEDCSLVSHAFGVLEPGDYVLAGPTRDGRRVVFFDAAARDVDTIAFRLAAPAQRA